MKPNSALAISATILLSGCSDPNIELVKNYPSENSEYTYSQVLDHREICKDIEWSAIQDERGRDFVIYKCTHEALSRPILDDVINRKVEHLKHQEKQYLDTFALTKERLAEKLDAANVDMSGEIEKLRMEVAELEKKYNISVEKNDNSNEPASRGQKESYWEMLDAHKELSNKQDELERLVHRQTDEWAVNRRAADRKDAEDKLAALAAIEESYKASVSDMIHREEAIIRSTYNDSKQAREEIHFLITNSGVRLQNYKMLIDNNDTGTSFNDVIRLALEMAKPSAEMAQEWKKRWTGALHELHKGNYKIPYSCDSWEGRCYQR